MIEGNHIDFQCPHCDKDVTFPNRLAGLLQACPHCFKPIIVPRDGSSKGGILPLAIHTSNLDLRPPITEDLPDLVEMFSDEKCYMFSDAYPADEADVQRWFQASNAVQLSDPAGYLNLSARLSQERKVIGYTSFYFADDESMKQEHRSGAFTMMVNSAYWNRGFGTEIARAMLRFGFEAINLHDIRVSIDSRNLAAYAVLIRIGMRKEGEFIEDKFTKGKWIDISCFGVLRREYSAPVDVFTD